MTQDEHFTVPFWVIFRILKSTDDTKNDNTLSLEVMYHIPMYKSHSNLNENLIDIELHRIVDTLSKRLRLMLILL